MSSTAVCPDPDGAQRSHVSSLWQLANFSWMFPSVSRVNSFRVACRSTPPGLRVRFCTSATKICKQIHPAAHHQRARVSTLFSLTLPVETSPHYSLWFIPAVSWRSLLECRCSGLRRFDGPAGWKTQARFGRERHRPERNDGKRVRQEAPVFLV